MVRTIPTLPFEAPEKLLPTIAQVKLFENPKNKVLPIAHVRDRRTAYLRPMRSARCCQEKLVKHWATEKTAAVMPAYVRAIGVSLETDNIAGCR